MKTFDLKSLLLGVVLTMTIVVVMLLATSTSGPATWEYKVLSGTYMGLNYQNQINSAANDGWEVVGVGTDSQGYAYAVARRPKAGPRRPWWMFWKK